jgi:hypothetical protein
MLASPYVVGPENLNFAQPGLLSFTMEGIEDTPLFLAHLKDGEWQMLPSRIDNGSIAADIVVPGIYGLMTLEEETAAPTTVTTATEATMTPALAPVLGIFLSSAALALAGFLVRRNGL